MKSRFRTMIATEAETEQITDEIDTYESRLQLQPRWALTEGSRFFEETGAVQDTLRRVTHRLDALGIPYAVTGGLALFAHGYRRFTEDIDLLVTPEGLKRVHKELEGLGYIVPFAGSKNLRDASSRVKIEFLVTGQYPGDGKPKPVSFPDPTAVAVEKDGIKYLSLPSLVELKLASGMTEPTRLKDITDVIELIKILDLPADFSDQLAPFVRAKFLELRSSIQMKQKRFLRLWRSKFLTRDATSMEEMAQILRASAKLLDAMHADGVTLDPNGAARDDNAYLVTTDPAVAKKYDMHEESEFWDEDDDEGDTPGAPTEPSTTNAPTG